MDVLYWLAANDCLALFLTVAVFFIASYCSRYDLTLFRSWQAKRLGALNKFKAGECNILVCTDVASRGLDIPNVDLVINYDIPSNSKVWLH